MGRKLLFFAFFMTLSFSLVSPILALEKVKFGGNIRMAPQFYLPPLTAEEKGFWKENGLDVEWVPFAGTVPHMRAVAAGVISVGVTGSADAATAAARGLPVVMVAELFGQPQFRLWARADKPYRQVRDLKGARVSVTALGAATHVFGRVMFASHGMEKDIRFVGAGGTPEQLAALMAGAVDASVEGLFAWVRPYQEGKIREIGNPIDFLPRPWVGIVTFARKDFAASKPDVVRKMLRTILQSMEFMRKNPDWTRDKMKSFQGLSEEGAKLIYDWVGFTTTGRIEPKGMENLRNFFIQYGVLPEKSPTVEELFTNEYLP